MGIIKISKKAERKQQKNKSEYLKDQTNMKQSKNKRKHKITKKIVCEDSEENVRYENISYNSSKNRLSANKDKQFKLIENIYILCHWSTVFVPIITVQQT